MTPPAPSFRQLAARPLDVDDDALKKLGDDLGIPALVRPEPKAPETAPSHVSAEAQNLPEEKISARAAPTPAPRTKKRTMGQKSAPAVDPVSEKRCRVSIDILPMLDEQLCQRQFESDPGSAGIGNFNLTHPFSVTVPPLDRPWSWLAVP